METRARIVGESVRAALAAAMMTAAGLALGSCAQDGASSGLGGAPASGESARVRDIDAAVRSASAARVRQDVDRLAAFGTRHTLSDTTSPTRGIGAAREWIKAEFERIAAASGRPASGPDAIRVWFDRHTQAPDGRRITREVEIVNVMCEIPGSDPARRDRRYYMTAHYDTICSDFVDPVCDAPGANDNASGVSVLLETARVLSSRRFPATIVLMATAGEEQGLYGARLHAAAARKAGLDIRADLNNDIVGDPLGHLDPRGGAALTGALGDGPTRAQIDEALRTVRVFCEGLPNPAAPIPEGPGAQGATSASTATSGAGKDPAREAQLRSIHSMGAENDGPARTLARYVLEIAARHALPVQPMMVQRNDRFLRGGDHTAFIEQGYASAVRFTAMHEDYDRQHQNVRTEKARRPDGSEVDVQFGDLPQFVNAEYLAGVARVNAAAIAHLASAPEAPRNARIVTAKLQSATTLRWDAARPEDRVARYAIVWRRTTSPFWEGAIDAGAGTEATIDMNKDHHFFGVRAVDADGFWSPVSFPGAARE